LEELAAKKVIRDFVWSDGDGKPDFELRFHNRKLRVECKSIRSLVGKKENQRFRVELQKTRNSKDGAPTRGYLIGHFDILWCVYLTERGSGSISTFLRIGLPDEPPIHICWKSCRQFLSWPAGILERFIRRCSERS
jgi:hypothetical protein